MTSVTYTQADVDALSPKDEAEWAGYLLMGRVYYQNGSWLVKQDNNRVFGWGCRQKALTVLRDPNARWPYQRSKIGSGFWTRNG